MKDSNASKSSSGSSSSTNSSNNSSNNSSTGKGGGSGAGAGSSGESHDHDHGEGAMHRSARGGETSRSFGRGMQSPDSTEAVLDATTGEADPRARGEGALPPGDNDQASNSSRGSGNRNR